MTTGWKVRWAILTGFGRHLGFIGNHRRLCISGHAKILGKRTSRLGKSNQVGDSTMVAVENICAALVNLDHDTAAEGIPCIMMTLASIAAPSACSLSWG